MDNKRAPLRQFYQSKDEQVIARKQYADRTKQLDAIEDTIVAAFNALIKFMDGKTSKTEVVNQLKSISTPDVDKVVEALSKLDTDILSNKLDLKPVTDALNSLKREITLIPSKMPKSPEAKDAVTVTNLDQITFDTTHLEKAIKDIKLDPKIDVKSPIVNVDAPDLKPIKNVLLDVIKAIKDQQYPDFPEIPQTDLSKVEKKLDESNKHLKAIVEKPVGGGGGGGGNGTPYQNESANASYVTLKGGYIPIYEGALTNRYDYDDSTTIYTAFAIIGTSDASTGWTITKYDLTDTNDASGKIATDVSWANRASGSFN